jgi:hypothetical protein
VSDEESVTGNQVVEAEAGLQMTQSVMRFSLRILAFGLCLMILALNSTQVAFALTEIAYDDGMPETTTSLDIGMFLAVKFSLPSDMPKARLLAARVYKAGRGETDMRIHVLGSDGATNLTKPFAFRLALESKWNDVNLTAHNIVVSEDFYIAVEYLAYYDPLIGRDTTNPRGRSYYGRPRSWSPAPNNENVMIRAIIDHPSATTSRTSQTSSVPSVSGPEPYILVAVFVTSVSVAVVMKRWKNLAVGRKATP